MILGAALTACGGALPARGVQSGPTMQSATTPFGAFPGVKGTTFRVWAPKAKAVGVRLFRPSTRTIALERHDDGVWSITAPDVGEGATYKFVVDDRELPDPGARFLPEGVHGPAEVVADHAPTTSFVPPKLDELVIYELHVGTFTDEGTYVAAMHELDQLADLGVNAIELLPVAAFAGERGWGYDGVALYAPHAPYGRPEELRAFVAAAHARGIAVLLDVVYNHLGPAGNYFGAYTDEFLGKVDSPWGQGFAFDNRFVRTFVLENVRYWLESFGFDGLRLDATHAIIDDSPKHILEDIAQLAHGLVPRRIVIGEDERNDPTVMTRTGLDAVWADDFHHSVRVNLTREQDGYYKAYAPTLAELAHTIDRGWLYEGQVYGPSGEKRGHPATGLARGSFVYCIQNHDQVGNRALGTRLNHEVSIDAYLVATMLLLFLPQTPMLFQGQEWAASTPFVYFTDHEPDLGKLVTEGRRKEFAKFAAFADPEQRAKIPDPQSRDSFVKSKLKWDERGQGDHARALALTRTMLHLRRDDAVLGGVHREEKPLQVRVEGQRLVVVRESAKGKRTLVLQLAGEPMPLPAGRVLLRSGEGVPFAALLAT